MFNDPCNPTNWLAPLSMSGGGSNPCDQKNSSVPLLGGGDTHIHPFGLGMNDSTIGDDFVFIMLKPLAEQQEVVRQKILARLCHYGDIGFMQEGVIVTEDHVRQHYCHLVGRAPYAPLVRYLVGKQVSTFILEESSAIKSQRIADGYACFAHFLRRVVIGPSHPLKAQPNHIRHLPIDFGLPYAITQGYMYRVKDNLIHCSENPLAAMNEIGIWYKETPCIIERFAAQLSLPKFLSMVV